MTKKQKRMLRRILTALALYLIFTVCLQFLQIPAAIIFLIYFLIYLYIAWDILVKAIRHLGSRQMMDENFLMAAASLGAFLLGEYSEAVAVILFYQIGEWFQSYAVNRSRKSIAALMDIRPEYANLEVDGTIEEVDPDSVQVGQTIVINPGERVPLDGIVLSGRSSLDTSALTGESVPRSVHEGSDVISGCINQSGVLKVRVTKVYGQSTVARILELVENATDKKAESEKFITRFARYYTPMVVYAAIALGIIPSLLTGQWQVWIYRALEFLVVSCPCALVISVPLSFFGGIGAASRCGILVKGSNYLEQLAEVKTMLFDKTGTLTKGNFQVTNIFPEGMNSDQLLLLAASAEASSSHPIARSIFTAAGGQSLQKAENVQEIAGQGVQAEIAGSLVCVGNPLMMKNQNITQPLPTGNGFGTCVYVSRNGRYIGMIEIADEIKEDGKVVLDMLRKYGVEKFIMLTGDDVNVASAVADHLGIDEYHAGLLPQQKAEYVQKLLAQQNNKEKLAFIGDGINDAPVLMQADVGIAMGALGSDAAIEAADIVLMDDQLDDLVSAMAISRKTLRISWQNIIFAIAVKSIILIAGAFGYASMWAAVFADVGVAFLCILNAMRALNFKKIDVNAERTE